LAEAPEVQGHLALSREFLGTATAALERGELFPARFNALHALELGVKAALLAKTGRIPRTHNVGGEFARHFRGQVGDALCSEVNRALDAYSASRYPDAPPVSRDKLAKEIARRARRAPRRPHPRQGSRRMRGLRPPVPDPLLDLLPKARRRWARTDPVLHRIAKEHPPAARSVEWGPPFEALVGSITHQQVSLAAGRTIFRRVEEASGSAVTPEGILAAGPDRLRAAGLSRPKVAYVLDLAEKTAKGEVDFARLAAAPDAEVVETLTEVKGIGVWTAKMFLIFHLHRPDVLAPEDLGLQIAVARAYRVPRKSAVRKMEKMGPLWAPYNSVAALTLWNWRHVMDAQEGSALSHT